MKDRKVRLTVTIDRDLLRVANAAIAGGKVASVSAWVNAALAEQAARERRQYRLAQVVSEYETAHGVVGGAELEAQRRADQRAAIAVKPRGNTKRRRTA